jgi:hypothetical protein
MRASSQHAAQWPEADPRHGDAGFIFREYLCVDGVLRQVLISRGIVILGRRALGNLIDGMSAEFRHIPAQTSHDTLQLT